MARGKTPKSRLTSLALPEDHAKKEGAERTRGIGRSVPNVGRTSMTEPILPTFVRNPKTGAEGEQAPWESTRSFPESSPSQATHKGILNEMQKLVRDRLRTVRQVTRTHARQVQHDHAIGRQSDSPLHHVPILALRFAFSNGKLLPKEPDQESQRQA